MPLFGKPKHTSLVIIDVGSSSVGVGLAQVSAGAKPHIAWAAREEMVFQTELNFSRFFSSMLDALDRCLERLEKESNDIPKSFVVSFASPWYVSQTRMVTVERDTPFTVTEKGIRTLIEREVDAFRTKQLPQYENVAEEETDILEAESIQVKLNGYDVPNPYGVAARSMKMAVYVSMSSHKVLTAVEQRIFKRFHGRTVKFHSFPLVAFSTIRDTFVDANDFLFLDISGEVTDVSIVRDDVILETISFPLGKNFLIRRIAAAHNTVPEEAASLLRLFAAGKADDAVRMKLQTTLIAARQEWMKYFTEALASLSSDLALPYRVFFTADQDVAPWFADVLRSEEFEKYTFTDEPFQVTIFDTPILSGFSSIAAEVPQDPFVLLEAVFAAKVAQVR